MPATATPPRKASSTQSPSTYSFHGSNSSHSKDNGAGGRTYHMPNYATSYANEKSNLITIHLEEDRGGKRAMLLTSLLLACIALPFLHFFAKSRQLNYDFANPSLSFQMTSTADSKPDEASFETSSARANESRNPSGKDYFKGKGRQNDRDPYWEEPTPASQCLAYGMQDYSARLWNLPFFSSWKAACENMPIQIRGQEFERPDHCENKWPFGGTIGHWKVKDESKCSPRWGKIEDKGCIAKGFRLIQSRLWGVENPDDWKALCMSAPAVVKGTSFDHPNRCENKGWLFGIRGQWEVKDPKC